MRACVLFLILGIGAQPVSAQVGPNFELDGFTVTGAARPRTSDAASSRVTVLEGSELRTMGIRTVAGALRLAGGLSLARVGSFGGVTSVFSRGGESDFVQVLIDGVQVNQAGGSFDFAGLTTEDVERIEVLRGPASALYGSDAMTGVIHVITRSGSGDPAGHLAMRGGSFGRRDVTASIHGGTTTVSYGLTGSHLDSDGILPMNNRHRATSFSGTVRLAPDSRTSVRLNARRQDRRFHFPTDGSGNVVDENSFTFGDETLVGVEVNRRVGSKGDIALSIASFETETGTDDAPDGPADTVGFFGFGSLNASERTEARLTSMVELTPELGVVGGAEWELQTQRSFSESLSEFGSSTGRSDDRRSNTALFAQLTASEGGIYADAGVRRENNERFGGSTTWQLGLAWRPHELTRIRTSAGTAIKDPTFFENYATGFAIGNPDLDPERARSWEVGVEQGMMGGALTLSLGWFSQRFRDLIQYSFTPPTPGGPNFFNVAEANSSGFEVSGEGQIGSLRLVADATVLETEVVDSGFDTGVGATFVEGGQLLRRPRFSGTFVSSYTAGSRVSMSGTLRFVGEREDRDFATFPATPVTLPADFLIDLSLDVRVADAVGRRPGLAITIRGENLTNRGYQEVFGFDAPGRGVYLGGRLELGER